MENIEKIMNELPSRQAAIVSSNVNRRYLTGFKSSSGVLVLTKERSYLLVDFRYFEKAREVIKNCRVVLLSDFNAQINHIFEKFNIARVSVESHEMTLHELTDYIERFPKIEFDSSPWLSNILIQQRLVKTEDELKKIQSAQHIAEKSFNRLLTKIHIGITEKQVASLLNYFMIGYGADDVSFSTIAASGVNSSFPHAEPTDKPLQNGEFLILDFGATYRGYQSDMTRTISIGEPTEFMRNVYNAVLGANNDAMKAVKPGVSGKLIDNVARSTLEAWGYDKYFGHGLGHGVGLEVHEAPNLSPKGENMLKEGMVVTIEPGVYLPGEFGVRIEDMVVVTKSGCINLTRIPKSLMRI